jgi:ParB family chromosome partitioning protein
MNAVIQDHTTRVPLGALRVSSLNVRKTGGGNVTDLVASILALGLLNPPTVLAANDGTFEVVAGARRLRALQQLQKEGRLPAELEQVPCLVVDHDQAAEASLAENTIREAMHPADQFEAFQRVLDQGRTVDEVAAHFSVTPAFVRQRMKLAAVSPKVLEAFREGKLTLKVVELYALGDDHAEQEKILANGGTEEWTVRNAMTKRMIPATDRRIRAIGGLDAYEAAGGAVTRDLFSAAGDAYAVDSKLVKRLVDQKLESEATKLREAGWSFVDVGADLKEWTYGRAGKGEKADKAKTGAIVTINYEGEIEAITGLTKPAAQKPGGVSPTTAKAKPADPAELPGKEAEALAVARDLRSALHLANTPKKALALLAANFAASFILERYHQTGVDALLNFETYGGGDHEAPEKDPSEAALKTIENELRKKLPRSGSLVAWALEQPPALLERIVAYGTARALYLGSQYGGDCGPELANLLRLDPAGGWKPTADWLAKQSPAYVLATVKKELGQKAADDIALTKGNAAIAGKAAQLLEAAGWLPPPLRGKGYALKPGAKPAAAEKQLATAAKAKPAPAKQTAKKTPAKKATKAPAKKAAKKKGSK